MGDYEPICPIGKTDCVWDPAYIKCNYPDWYDRLYGDSHVNGLPLQDCIDHLNKDGTCNGYDDEDQ